MYHNYHEDLDLSNQITGFPVPPFGTGGNQECCSNPCRCHCPGICPIECVGPTGPQGPMGLRGCPGERGYPVLPEPWDHKVM